MVINNITIQTENKPLILNNKQVRTFSMAIAPDIRKYIEEHSDVYEEWLKKHEKGDSNEKLKEKKTMDSLEK